MPRGGFTNLSIEASRYDSIRKLYDKSVDTDLSFSNWAMTMIENSVNRMAYLKEKYPDLRIVDVTETGVIVENIKTEELSKVNITNGKVTCKSSNAEKIIDFVKIHPEVDF